MDRIGSERGTHNLSRGTRTSSRNEIVKRDEDVVVKGERDDLVRIDVMFIRE